MSVVLLLESLLAENNLWRCSILLIQARLINFSIIYLIVPQINLEDGELSPIFFKFNLIWSQWNRFWQLKNRLHFNLPMYYLQITIH